MLLALRFTQERKGPITGRRRVCRLVTNQLTQLWAIGLLSTLARRRRQTSKLTATSVVRRLSARSIVFARREIGL